MKKLVLVADDDFEITQVLSIRLKQLGFSVMRSPDASHALFGAQRLQPDLIIMDVNMPGGNGLAVADMLASDAEYCKIPMIIHTGRSDEATLARCKELGHQYVQKSSHSWDEIKAFVCKQFDIDPDQERPKDAVGDGNVPRAADAGRTQPQAENQQVTTGNDFGLDNVEEILRSKTEIGASTCITLDGGAEQTQPSCQPDNNGVSSSENAATPSSQSDNQQGAPSNISGDDDEPAPLPTWAEIRAGICKALNSEAEQSQPNDQFADDGELSAAHDTGSEPTGIIGLAASTRQSIAVESGAVTEPELPQTARPLQVLTECRDPEAVAIDANHPIVLCIDDDPDISKVIKLRLAAYGVEVLRAFSGMQGFWTALDYRPDVIICDMSMPDGEGNYILGRFKSHPLTENTPVIILTGQTNPGTKRTITALGASAYLTKPLIFDELLHALRSHIKLPDKPLDTTLTDSVLSVGST